MKQSELRTSEEKVTREGVEASSKLMPPETIMIVVRGMILAHTFPVGRTTVEAVFNQDMKALVVSKDYRPKYIQYRFEYASRQYLQLVSESSHGTKRLESDKLFSLSVPRPKLHEQDEFIAQVDEIQARVTYSEARMRGTMDLKKQLLNQCPVRMEGRHAAL
jgi:type I restriction enzyme S subunit